MSEGDERVWPPLIDADVLRRIHKGDDRSETILRSADVLQQAAGPRLRELSGHDSPLGRMAKTLLKMQAHVDIVRSAMVWLCPLGWAITGDEPTPWLLSAWSSAESGDEEQAHATMTRIWSRPEWLRRYPLRLRGLATDDREREALWHRRGDLIDRAIDHHASGAYEASVPILLAQADGIVADATGRQMFLKGNKGRPIDARTLAGMQESLAVVREVLSVDESDTILGASLSRHGVLHGRVLGYDTERTSAHCMALIAAVTHLAQGAIHPRSSTR